MKYDDAATALAGLASEFYRAEQSWHIFGYTSKPPQNQLFAAYFNRRKLAREEFLRREFMILALHRLLRWINDRISTPSATVFAARTLEIAITDSTSTRPANWRHLGFTTISCARQYLREALLTYATHRFEEHHVLFFRRSLDLGVVAATDSKHVRAQWGFGIAAFFLESSLPYFYITLDRTVGIPTGAPVAPTDRSYLTEAETYLLALQSPGPVPP